MNDARIDAGPAGDLIAGDALRFAHAGHAYALFRTASGALHATDGLCTHGKVHLADGYLAQNLIECPKHNGCFDITTGQPKRRPATLALRTYPLHEEAGRLWLDPRPNAVAP